MTDLTNKLLQLSQAEASNSTAFPRQPIELVGLAATVLEELVSLAQRKHIDLGMETAVDEAWAMGSQALFSGMLMNLIDNALRYTPEHGKVTVGVALEDNKEVVITVADNGPSIPAEVRERVFERFYRNAAPDQHGAGLGMAIVKEIVQAAQGTITLGTDRDGKGLTVTVKLPTSSRP
jgi:two-component system sensor histidine kinase TctE